MSRRRWGDPLARDPNRRQARINDLLRRRISLILENRFRDQLAALLAVTEVRTTRDLRHARVFVSVYGDREKQENTIHSLQMQHREIRQMLASDIILKYIPSLEFILDLSLERAQRIEELLHGDDFDEP